MKNDLDPTFERYLIIIDLDGTLLPDFNSMDQATFSFIKDLNNLGHIIIIATGRPKRSSFFVYEALALNSPLINYNGALITNPTDSFYPVTDLRIDKTMLFTIIEDNKAIIDNVFCEIIDEIYLDHLTTDIYPYLHIDGSILHVGPLIEIIPNNPNSGLFFIKDGYVDSFQTYIKLHFGESLLTRYWGFGKYHIVEIFNIHVDKKKGAIDAMAYYHIDKDHTIAIGDGDNDKGLLDSVGIKVAMGNANKELFTHANYITDTCLEQGVLKFLQKFFNDK